MFYVQCETFRLCNRPLRQAKALWSLTYLSAPKHMQNCKMHFLHWSKIHKTVMKLTNMYFRSQN